MGGLARRVSYIKAFKVRSNNEVPTLFVDAGNLFTDDRFSGGQLPPEVMTKNKWVVKSYGDFRCEAANVNYNDLPYLSELLKKQGYDDRVEELPFIKKIVSANVQPLADNVAAPVPYVIREITLKRSSPGKTIKIGITGFTDAKPTGPNQKESAIAAFRIEDPLQAAKRVLPELKSKVDLVIALAYMPQEMAQRLASENPEIDTIIGARQLNSQEELQHFNRATIAYSFNQTKYLGELRFYVKGNGSIENQVNRFVGLDSFIPDDPVALQTVKGAHDEFTNEQSKSATAAASTLPSMLPSTTLLGNTESPYIGGDTCAGCHVEEHEIWEKTGHAHAMATLEKKNQQFDNECVKCHVVGFENGGFKALYSTPQFANVQCEACHGPGRNHAAAPAKGYGKIQTPIGCVQCHTEPNSPDFNFETYWAKVAHKNSIIR